MNPTPEGALYQAADLIEEAGWWQEGYHDNSGYCPITALSHLPISAVTMSDALDLLRDRIGTLSISDWNDAVDRTQAEVLAVMRGQVAA